MKDHPVFPCETKFMGSASVLGAAFGITVSYLGYFDELLIGCLATMFLTAIIGVSYENYARKKERDLGTKEPESDEWPSGEELLKAIEGRSPQWQMGFAHALEFLRSHAFSRISEPSKDYVADTRAFNVVDMPESVREAIEQAVDFFGEPLPEDGVVWSKVGGDLRQALKDLGGDV